VDAWNHQKNILTKNFPLQKKGMALIFKFFLCVPLSVTRTTTTGQVLLLHVTPPFISQAKAIKGLEGSTVKHNVHEVEGATCMLPHG
jgi:hypothetical protein